MIIANMLLKQSQLGQLKDENPSGFRPEGHKH